MENLQRLYVQIYKREKVGALNCHLFRFIIEDTWPHNCLLLNVEKILWLGVKTLETQRAVVVPEFCQRAEKGCIVLSNIPVITVVKDPVFLGSSERSLALMFRYTRRHRKVFLQLTLRGALSRPCSRDARLRPLLYGVQTHNSIFMTWLFHILSHLLQHLIPDTNFWS